MSDIEKKEVIKESLNTSIRKETKQAKMARLIGKMAMQMAKTNNDPLYAKAQKAKQIYIKAKGMIQKKYGQKSKMAAKKAASKK